ncbi:hypothetical protein CCUS01_09699 [Colletotrichum cuscutae]|uniref:C2H2-type domain-containing protein n=1 Tax=Colletotrichum cuscutae TaxID=1209917 RepID=A0AAI9UID2_9PEZI|nr:hypothetical protein CCUS01_09699 [Colletotrichum cuscutae]
MSNKASRPLSKLCCLEPICAMRVFSTQSNLNRHMRAKHGPSVPVFCGKLLPNHSSNVKRHTNTCQDCLAAMNLMTNIMADNVTENP